MGEILLPFSSLSVALDPAPKRSCCGWEVKSASADRHRNSTEGESYLSSRVAAIRFWIESLLLFFLSLSFYFLVPYAASLVRNEQ